MTVHCTVWAVDSFGAFFNVSLGVSFVSFKVTVAVNSFGVFFAVSFVSFKETVANLVETFVVAGMG